MLHTLRQFGRLSWRERGLLLEATALTGLARLALLCVSFRRLAPWLGRTMGSTSEASDPMDEEISDGIRWAVTLASRHVAWESKCLVQAIAARAMLGRRGVPGTIYLGVARDGGEIKAHAWLRTGRLIVTGAHDSVGFTVVSTFAFGHECAE